VAHEVKLEVFEGPIDLLLHLITRQRVDIYDISLSQITEEYLGAIEDIDALDLESATGFLVVAATLLELKSSRLLPSRGAEDADAALLEQRDLLLARLVECATYRSAGSWLRAALAAGERFHPRPEGLEGHFVAMAPDPLARVTLGDLTRVAASILAPKSRPELDTSHLAPIRATVRDAIVEIAGRLDDSTRAFSFEELCGGIQERIEVVVRFLALLELFKAGAVELEQPDRWGDIVVLWTGEIDAAAVAVDAEEYTVQEAGETEAVR
jgi:segregation and condensation protein A